MKTLRLMNLIGNVPFLLNKKKWIRTAKFQQKLCLEIDLPLSVERFCLFCSFRSCLKVQFVQYSIGIHKNPVRKNYSYFPR